MSDESPSSFEAYATTAAAYDLLHRSDDAATAATVSTIERIVRRHVPHADSLLDVACGTGVHLAALRPHFSLLAGVDTSAAMLERASHLGSFQLVEGDMRTFSLDDRFDAVLCLFSSIGYMTTIEDLDEAISNMARHLSDSGVLIVEGWVLPEKWSDRPPHVIAAEDGPRKAARMASSHRDGWLTTLDMHWLMSEGDSIDYARELHVLRLFTRDEYRDSIERAGLQFHEADGLTGRGLYVGVTP